MTKTAPPPDPPSPDTPRAAPSASLRRVPDGAWVASTYFAEGFPYSVVINLADLFFVAFGASLQAIGLTSLFHLPWNLKALVGPLLDTYETKRRWLVALEGALAACLVVLAFATTLPGVLAVASVMFVVLAALSAVHDIAIDGLYLEALAPEEQERLVGIRAPFWRFAAFVVTGPIAFVCDKAGWTVGFLVLAGGVGVLLAFHALVLPRTEARKLPITRLLASALRLRVLLGAIVVAVIIAGGRWALGSAWLKAGWTAVAAAAPRLAKELEKLGAADWIGLSMLLVLGVLLLLRGRIRRAIEASTSSYASSFVAFLAQPWAGRILVYIVLFRIGESFLMKMKVPFTRNLLDVSQAEYAVVNGTIGMLVGLAAPVVGGMLIAKYGFHRCIWPFLLAQNGLHMLFALGAFYAPEIVALKQPLVSAIVGMRVVAVVDVRILVVTSIIVVETIGAGLGTAAFMVYIIRSCSPEHKAAHMALLTSLMSISFTVAGVFSGFLADWMGFGWYFTFTFLVTIPGMWLTLRVPHVAERGAPPRIP